MEILSAFEAWWAPVAIVFGVLASLDKAFDLYKKYKGLAQAPDDAQDKRLDELDKRIGIIEQGLLQHSAALARDLKRFDEIDRVSRLTLDGVRNLLDAQLNGDNKAGMEKSKADIDKYLLEGVTTWKQ